ncbi:hypothetical protein L2E82_20532 [Cichorium intybus]|uniref:Uncharacterized protein n=1 Tax=Cichorium intybus TaxID=13427 RepID=A0ACB9DTN7_CICIN|nr:hypothetical protein L2E82_20532 [Cichorium intybus]
MAVLLEFMTFSSDFSINGSVWAMSASRDADGLTATISTPSLALAIELSVRNVAFDTSVKTLVRALEDSHGSGGWFFSIGFDKEL